MMRRLPPLPGRQTGPTGGRRARATASHRWQERQIRCARVPVSRADGSASGTGRAQRARRKPRLPSTTTPIATARASIKLPRGVDCAVMATHDSRSKPGWPPPATSARNGTASQRNRTAGGRACRRQRPRCGPPVRPGTGRPEPRRHRGCRQWSGGIGLPAMTSGVARPHAPAAPGPCAVARIAPRMTDGGGATGISRRPMPRWRRWRQA